MSTLSCRLFLVRINFFCLIQYWRTQQHVNLNDAYAMGFLENALRVDFAGCPVLFRILDFAGMNGTPTAVTVVNALAQLRQAIPASDVHYG